MDAECHRYAYDKVTGLALTNAVTVCIAVVNVVLRGLNEGLIGWIGLHTLSHQTSVVMVSTFATGFINTGIVLMLTNANLSFYDVLGWIPLDN